MRSKESIVERNFMVFVDAADSSKPTMKSSKI
jgi:hypothetical protein